MNANCHEKERNEQISSDASDSSSDAFNKPLDASDEKLVLKRMGTRMEKGWERGEKQSEKTDIKKVVIS